MLPGITVEKALEQSLIMKFIDIKRNKLLYLY